MVLDFLMVLTGLFGELRLTSDEFVLGEFDLWEIFMGYCIWCILFLACL